MTSVDSSITSTAELICPECGYDLRQLSSDRCPECGQPIDRSVLGESIIPWIHRHKIGRYRAFWRTVNLATFHPKYLAREMSRPARFEDAVKFRRMVVLHALVPLGLIGTAAYIYFLRGMSFATGGLWVSSDVPGSCFQIGGLVVGWLCLAMFLFGISGAASYWFHPRSISMVRQNRAVALSYYACAPIAYTPLTLLLVFLAMVNLDMIHWPRVSFLLVGVLFLISIGPIIGQGITILNSPVTLLEATTRLGSARQAAMCFLLPLMWAVIAFATLVALPAMYVAVTLMVLSFRQ